MCICACVLSLQSCPTLCDPMDPARLRRPWDPSGQNISMGCHALLRGSSRPRDQTLVSCTAGGFFTAKPLGRPIYVRMCVCVSVCKIHLFAVNYKNTIAGKWLVWIMPFLREHLFNTNIASSGIFHH